MIDPDEADLEDDIGEVVGSCDHSAYCSVVGSASRVFG